MNFRIGFWRPPYSRARLRGRRRSAASTIHMKTERLPRTLRAVLIASFAVLLGVQAFWALRRERRFTPDSRNYVNVADNLLRGRGFVQDSVGLGSRRIPLPLEIPQRFGVHGPAFPILIAGAGLLGFETTDTALFVPVLANGFVLLLAFLLMRSLYDLTVALWTTLLLTVSFPLRRMIGVAWSEPLALAFLLLSLFLLLRRPLAETPRAAILAAGLCAGLAFATRYPLGVAFPLGLVLLLRWRDWRGSVLRALDYGIGFTAIGGAVLLRNLLSTGYLTGTERNPSTVGLAENAERAVHVLLGQWLLLPVRLSFRIGDVVLDWIRIELALVLLVGLALAIRIARKGGWALVRERFLVRRRAVLLIWLLGYTAFLVLQRSYSSFDYLHARLLSPAHLFMMGLLAVSLALVLPLGPRVLAVLGIVACLGSSVSYALDAYRRPSAWSRPFGAVSERRKWVKQVVQPNDVLIAQRCTDLVFLQDRACLHFSLYPEMEHVTYADILAVRGQACGPYEKVYVLLQAEKLSEADLLDRYGRFVTDLFRGRLAFYPDVEEIARLQDGTAFRVHCPGFRGARAQGGLKRGAPL
jgi:hypothetical protein